MAGAGLFSKHHIGGRNGRGGFPDLPGLHGSIASTVYEADASCCPQIEAEQRAAGYGAIQIIPACVGLSRTTVSFSINFEPYTSSILNLSPKYKNFYYDMGRFDYTYECAMSPVKQVQMETVSLDDMQPKYPIDFLSLDTQGSELTILSGAGASLKNIVGVETEVSFRQIYEDSALFGEICSFLNGLGFEFIRFTTITQDAPRTMPTLGRLEKMLSFGDALFLRKPVAGMAEDQQRKLVFSALAYGQVEYAAHCVKELGLCTNGGHQGDSANTWAQFVNEFVSIVAKENSLPRGLADITSADELTARFDLPSKAEKVDLHPVRLLKNIFVKLPRNVQIAIIRIVHTHQFADYLFGKSSDLESMYQRAGRNEIAKQLRVSRFRRIFPLF